VRRVKGDIEGALQDCNEAIRLKPDDAVAFFNRSVARLAKGDTEGALQDCNEAIRLKPDDAVAFFNRSVARLAKGDTEGALQDCNEAIRLKPDNATAFFSRGLLRGAKGDVWGALQDGSKAIRLGYRPFQKGLEIRAQAETHRSASPEMEEKRAWICGLDGKMEFYTPDLSAASRLCPLFPGQL
jgi:tetratricopeptide (TPR) repeat protein